MSLYLYWFGSTFLYKKNQSRKWIYFNVSFHILFWLRQTRLVLQKYIATLPSLMDEINRHYILPWHVLLHSTTSKSKWMHIRGQLLQGYPDSFSLRGGPFLSVLSPTLSVKLKRDNVWTTEGDNSIKTQKRHRATPEIEKGSYREFARPQNKERYMQRLPSVPKSHMWD